MNDSSFRSVFPRQKRLASIEDQEHPRCQAPNCNRYIPSSRLTGQKVAKYCSQKCANRVSSRNWISRQKRDLCGCGKTKLAISEVCQSCAKQWSLERDKLEKERNRN